MAKRYHVTNRTSELRKFSGGGRFLTLAGGESERNVELQDDEAEALKATGEFHVREVEAPKTEDKPAAQTRPIAQPAQADKNA